MKPKLGCKMANKNLFSNLLVTFLLIIIHPIPVLASEYACTIKAVLDLNGFGLYKSHGWGANYMNRKFFVNHESGKVIGTTALKAHLTNFNKTSSPKVLLNAEEKSSRIVEQFLKVMVSFHPFG